MQTQISSTSANFHKIPATVVTGFLGSGKTTLLSNILKQANNKRIALIVNEFGELDIDANLLRTAVSCADDACEITHSESAQSGIYELANGCICCTVEEEFLPVMQELVRRRDEIDHILIETSGLALPKPLVQAFNWPDIKQYCTVDAVVTVLDGPAVAAGRFAHDVEQVQAQRLADESLDHDPSLQELLEDQLSAADLVVVSKNDLLDQQQRADVQTLVSAKVPDAVKTLYISQGQVDLQSLMGLDAAAEAQIEYVHNHHDHHHAHGEHHEHAHDHFDSFVLRLGEVNTERLQATLQALLATQAIYRVKGFAALPMKPMRQVVQAVGKRLDVYFDRLWQMDEARETQLIFIGKQLDQVAIRAALQTAALA